MGYEAKDIEGGSKRSIPFGSSNQNRLQSPVPVMMEELNRHFTRAKSKLDSPFAYFPGLLKMAPPNTLLLVPKPMG